MPSENVVRPTIIHAQGVARLNVSHVQALAYLVAAFGPTTAAAAGQAFCREFPGVATPKANWHTVLSQAAHQGLVRKVARGVFAA